MTSINKDLFYIKLSDDNQLKAIAFDLQNLVVSNTLQTASKLISHYELSKIEGNCFTIKIITSFPMTQSEFESVVLKNLAFSCYHYTADKHLTLNVLECS
jgi:hypothetical protein